MTDDDKRPRKACEVWVITGYDEWGEPIYGYVPAETADQWRADAWHPKP
ncbi:hypothetical protein [Rhodococcus gordoniae]|nr:hypothetical protein [Rhodococcus gordoniae]UTT48850.1 hypothetical protein NMQ04_01090 [Rhodococcus gordoniae]